MHAAAPCPPEVKRARHRVARARSSTSTTRAARASGSAPSAPTSGWPTPGRSGKSLLGAVHIVDADGDEVPAPARRARCWFEAPATLRVPRRPREDRGGVRRARVEHARRHRLGRRGRLPLPDRPGVEHDHLGRRQHLPPRGRGRAGRCTRRWPTSRSIGVPDPEMGEAVRAVVQPAEPTGGRRRRVADELIAFCRERLAHFKCPTVGRVRRRAAPPAHRQALPPPPPTRGHGLIPERPVSACGSLATSVDIRTQKRVGSVDGRRRRHRRVGGAPVGRHEAVLDAPLVADRHERVAVAAARGRGRSR